jgi:glycosyltransferase involved in cell wall biosynthesis
MKIGIDLQGAQSESRFRGIGRYSLSFAAALARHAGTHDIHLMLNRSLDAAIEPIRAVFEPLLPAERIHVFSTLGGVRESAGQSVWRTRAAERIREACIAGTRCDVVHVTSLVEGWLDDAVTSIGAFDRSTPTTATLYDLIPLLRQDAYLENPAYRDYYLRKVMSLKRAELLLAISEHARVEAIDALGLPAHRIVTIGCGIDECFTPAAAGSADDSLLQSRFGIANPYVFYSGGFDARKNVHALVEAYAALSPELRRRFALVIGGRINSVERNVLRNVAATCGLGAGVPIFTGELTDRELAALYRGATLFVFPSFHEGFGLPAGEAMACGTAVIASNASSLPEVVGRPDALFDPSDVGDMSQRIAAVLSDEGLRAELRTHGLQRARGFTWASCAARALDAFGELNSRRQARAGIATGGRRHRLAFVSPLPPERTGIADYSARLLHALADLYDIDVVVDQPSVGDSWIAANFPVRTIDWFDQHAEDFDRVLYHLGNSPFHRRMPALIDRHPGTVVLHDFFMSSMLDWCEREGGEPGVFMRALYASHGYGALADDRVLGRDEMRKRYPANSEFLARSAGAIVHSRHAVELARHWYGSEAGELFRQVPFMVAPAPKSERVAARKRLGVAQDTFLVCAFGFLAPTKLNERLLSAWLASPLAATRAELVFVGENEGGEYGRALAKAIADSDVAGRVRITGFVPEAQFGDWLDTVDVAVQLRSDSRGETSAAALECLVHGIPTVVNAHGSAAELPSDTVVMLAETFTDQALAAALTTLQENAALRAELGERAQAYIRANHSAAVSAASYRDAIEHFAVDSARARERQLVRQIAEIADASVNDIDLCDSARAIAANAAPFGPRQLLIDVTVVARNDLRTGIERVVRGVLAELLRNPPHGYRVEPVRDDGRGAYTYARRYALEALGLAADLLPEELVDARSGDVFLGLDWYADGIPRLADQLNDWRMRGVATHFVVYDLLPIRLPQAFPDTSKPIVETWLATIARCADGIACISRAVADDFAAWLREHPPHRHRPLAIGHFPLGASLDDTLPWRGETDELAASLETIRARPSFLMVGTVEPRKAHAQALDAFEILWREGADANLVIVGKEGWMMEPLATRLRNHPQAGKRLLWWERASDEALEEIYRSSTALLAPSLGEGFGLPLVEAAHRGLPLIARDIPVFREVAGEHACYFSGEDGSHLAVALRDWLELHKAGCAPASTGVTRLTWSESTRHLLDCILGGAWYTRWRPEPGPA